MVTSTWQCSFCLEGTKLWCLHVWNCGSGAGQGPGDDWLGRWSLWLAAARTGSFGLRRCLQALCTCWVLVVFQWSSLGSWFFIWWCQGLLVPCVRFWAFHSVIFNVCVSTQGCRLGGKSNFTVILPISVCEHHLKGSQGLCCWSWAFLLVDVSCSSFRLGLAVCSLFQLGHEPPPGLAGQVLLLVPKMKLGSVRSLPSLWVQAGSEFVHSVLWFFFLLSFWEQRWYNFFVEVGTIHWVIWLLDFPCSLKKWNWHLLKNIFPVLKIPMPSCLCSSQFFRAMSEQRWETHLCGGLFLS